MLKDSESLLVSGPGPRTQHPPWSLLTLAKGLLALSLVAAAVYASVLLHQLDKEVGMLRADLEHLKTNHFIDELRTFEKLYQQDQKNEDYYYDDPSDSKDDNLSIDNDEDEYEDGDELDDLNKSKRREKEEDKVVRSRLKRSVAEEDRDSIGLRLYDNFVTNGTKEVAASTESPIKSYHRISPAWPSKGHHHVKMHHHRQQSSPPVARAFRVMQTHTPPPPPLPPPPPPPPVLHVDAAYPHQPGNLLRAEGYRGFGGKTTYEENEHIKESRAGPEEVAYPVKPIRKPGKRRRGLNRSVEMLDSPGTGPARHSRQHVSAHLKGTTAHYHIGQHSHYHGNNRLNNRGVQIYQDWEPSGWMNFKHFNLTNGHLQVNDPGVYYIYAQIYYSDTHDMNGFAIYVDQMPIMECMVESRHVPGENNQLHKVNTCHTGGLHQLQANQKISIHDHHTDRVARLFGAGSYFGLFKIQGLTR